jgi:hypothetical protein
MLLMICNYLTHSKYNSGQLTKNYKLFLTITFLTVLHEKQIYFFCNSIRVNEYNNIINNFNNYLQICVTSITKNLIVVSNVYIIKLS